MIGFSVGQDGRIDVAYDGGLIEDDSFITDVIISLFTDQRAPDYVDLASADKRGWWGDPTWGSKLWLSRRGPLTPDVLVKVRQDVEDALAWMLDEKIVKSIDVATERVSRSAAKLAVELERGDGSRWAVVWRTTAERLDEIAIQGPYA